MADFKVSDVNLGGTDSVGAVILAVYSRVSGTYAVYRTDQRVIVQFADDAKLGGQQRLALAPLNPVRGQINGLIDGWRSSTDGAKQSKARLFDRRVADAMTVGLQGDVAHGLSLLTEVKADILAERTSIARSEYVIVASAATLAVATCCVLITSNWFSHAFSSFDATTDPVWTASAIGAVGALFSIALSIRSRSVLTDLQWRDNAVDAVLRIGIGAVSAAVLLCLLKGQWLTLGLGGKDLNFGKDPNALTVAAFVAGFSERLVGDLLNQAVASVVKSNTTAGAVATRPAAPTTSAANEQNPLGKAGPAPAVTDKIVLAGATATTPDQPADDGQTAAQAVDAGGSAEGPKPQPDQPGADKIPPPLPFES